MENIKRNFEREFKRWKLELPEEDLRLRRSGFIQQEGWLIQYVFGRNRFGEYLDYYACHRMTDDEHVRLYESGRRQYLSALGGMYVTSQDPVDAARLEKAFLRRNRRIARKLVAKGFDRFTINMMLHAGIVR
ncbi:MAG TPA: hypothetical protein PK014_03905 [Thermoanaerobaculia bacterium]|nr:hypothetical protein [Thermoanaerobaculia bacterium]HUM29200.1 hypothetical protein [Thermoanaerobaculia bacterium]HXK67841.1 hypothetical protein [Thermoanaerobaculia bacterium]